MYGRSGPKNGPLCWALLLFLLLSVGSDVRARSSCMVFMDMLHGSYYGPMVWTIETSGLGSMLL